MAFKEFWKRLFSRIGDVICELVAVKTAVMAVVTVVYVPVADGLGILGFAMFTLGWMGVIGFRYAEKYMNLVVKAKG